MSSYLLCRVVLTTIPTLLIVATFSFAITRAFLPSEFKPLMIEEYGRKDRSIGQKIDDEIGLKRQTPVQFAHWLGLSWPIDGQKGVLEGELGDSLHERKPVASLIFKRLANTLELAFVAQAYALSVALSLGFLAAVNRGSWLDRVVGAGSRLGAYPSLFLVVPYIVFAPSGFAWLRTYHYEPFWLDPLQNLRAMFLPGLFMSLMPMGILLRLARYQALEVLDDPTPVKNIAWLDRVRALKDTQVRGALVPIVLASGVSLQMLIGTTILFEQFFIVPGIGRLVVDATNNLDYPVMSGVILILATVLVVINRLAELLCAWLMSKPMRSRAESRDVALWRSMYGSG